MRCLLGILLISFIVTACDPISMATTGAAVAVGGMENFKKRDQLQKYAEHGDVYAQYDLAESYCCEPMHGGINIEASIYWYCTAARNGYGEAQVKVAELYDGTSKLNYDVAQDKKVAFAWYLLAARRVNPEAIKRKNEMEPMLKPSERQLASVMMRDKSKLACPVTKLPENLKEKETKDKDK